LEDTPFKKYLKWDKNYFQKLVILLKGIFDTQAKSGGFFIGKNNTTRTVQAESFKVASLSFDQGFQIVIPPRYPISVPKPIGTPSDGILHRSLDVYYINNKGQIQHKVWKSESNWDQKSQCELEFFDFVIKDLREAFP
jgi:hypothetical protein